MFIVTNSTYPLKSNREVAATFQKALETPLPPYIKRVNGLTTAGELGIKILGIYEVDDDKLADGIRELTKYYALFYDIEGFRYTLEPSLTVQEAIPLLGL